MKTYKRLAILLTLLMLICVVPSNRVLDIHAYGIEASPIEIGWYLNQVNATQAWNITKGEEDIVVAVVDSGIDFNHPEITHARWKNEEKENEYGWDFVLDKPITESGIEQSFHYHGTFISGIIAAAHNDEGIAGIAPNVKIMDLRVLNENNRQATAALGGAIYYAVDNGADVINLSLQYYTNSSFLYKEILYAYKHNVPVVSVTGNQDLEQGGGSEMISFPGGYDEVIAVGATNYFYEKADYSNYGEWTELVAPVGDINFTNIEHVMRGIYPPSFYGWGVGTSYAAPQVVATIALMKSINRDLSITEIRDILYSTATDLGEPGRDKYFGYGLLNITGAVIETPQLSQKSNLRRKIIIASIAIPSTIVFAMLVIVVVVVVKKTRYPNKEI